MYKEHIRSLRLKHAADGYERENPLTYLIAFLTEEGGEIQWPERVMKKRDENTERFALARELREEDGKGLVYSISGPSMRMKRLADAQAKYGFKDFEERNRRLWKRTSLRPELKVKRGRTTSMAVNVGGTSGDYTDFEDVGLTDRVLAEFDGSFSEAGNRNSAHVDALRFSFGNSSYIHPSGLSPPPGLPLPPGLSPSPTLPLHPPTIPISAKKRENWEPISIEDQHHENHGRQRPTSINSKEEGWGTDSEGIDSEDGMGNDDEKLSEEEIKEARRIVDEAKAKKKERNAAKKEREKDKTSIAVSFPGRSFF